MPHCAKGLAFARKEIVQAMVEVAAAGEARARLFLFLALGLLRACNVNAESGERGRKCLSIRGCIFRCLRDDGICIYL